MIAFILELFASPVFLFIFIWLTIYFVLTLMIFFQRRAYLQICIMKEKASQEALVLGQNLKQAGGYFKNCEESVLNMTLFENEAKIKFSKGLSFLSIVASTSPFIGLFGTVISILITFQGLGESAGLNTISKNISEALAATGVGIFVAIPAYSFHLSLRRKANELLSIISNQILIIKEREQRALQAASKSLSQQHPGQNPGPNRPNPLESIRARHNI